MDPMKMCDGPYVSYNLYMNDMTAGICSVVPACSKMLIVQY